MEEAEGTVPHAIYLQDIQESGPVQGIVSLVYVQEYCMEYHLPQGRNLLEQIDLEGGGPRCYVFVKTLDIFLLPADQYPIQIIGDRNYVGQHT